MASLYERSMDGDSKSFQPVPSQGKPIEEYVDVRRFADVANAQLSEKDNEVSKTKTGSLKDKYENPVEKRPDGSAETYKRSSTFFSWIKSWFPFSKRSAKSDDSTAHQNKVVSNFEDPKLSELGQTVSHFGERPSHQNWTRTEDLAHKLQKHGPMVLRSLTENEIFQLLELLIEEKKWLEESPSQAYPYRLTQPVQKNSSLGQAHGANGLRNTQKGIILVVFENNLLIESTYMLPSVPAVCASDSETCTLKTQVTNASHADSNSDNELSDSAPKYDNMESPWEELGENYDSSESEDDSPCSTQLEEQGKAKCNEQDSSFWQALDLWHSSKEGENSVKKSDNIEGLGSSLIDLINSSTESSRGTISKIPSGISREKQRSRKYSFVADPVLPDKDKLIDGILDGFKKADEQKCKTEEFLV
ncbi:hypothetical protein SESBI_08119 [Sesbania bispinosa]|nr:hypothetical protein SESBI_08119 [Sesbania bispinosa]